MMDDLKSAVAGVLGAEVRSVFDDAAQFRQVQVVLGDWLQSTARARIYEDHPGVWVVVKGDTSERLFKSVSYAACLEWLLSGDVPEVKEVETPEATRTFGGKIANVLQHHKREA